MPRNLHVCNVDDEIVLRLSLRARRHGRSVEAEHREILRQALCGQPTEPFEELAAQFRALTAGRKHTPSELLQREG